MSSRRNNTSDYMRDILTNSTAGLGTRFAPEHVAAALRRNNKRVIDVTAQEPVAMAGESESADIENGVGTIPSTEGQGLGQASFQYYIPSDANDPNWYPWQQKLGINAGSKYASSVQPQFDYAVDKTGYGVVSLPVAGTTLQALPVAYTDLSSLFRSFPVKLDDGNGNTIFYMGYPGSPGSTVPSQKIRRTGTVSSYGQQLQQNGFDMATANGTIHIDPWLYSYNARTNMGMSETQLQTAYDSSAAERAAGLAQDIANYGNITPSQARGIIATRQAQGQFIPPDVQNLANQQIPPPAFNPYVVPGGRIGTQNINQAALAALAAAGTLRCVVDGNCPIGYACNNGLCAPVGSFAACPTGYQRVPPGQRGYCPRGYMVQVDPASQCQGCVPFQCSPGYRNIPIGFALRCPTGYLTQVDPANGICQACVPLCGPGYAVPPCPPGQSIVGTDATGKCVQCSGGPTPGAGGCTPGFQPPPCPIGSQLISTDPSGCVQCSQTGAAPAPGFPGTTPTPFLPGTTTTPTTTTPAPAGGTLFAGMGAGGASALMGLAALAIYGVYRASKKGTGLTEEAQRERYSDEPAASRPARR